MSEPVEGQTPEASATPAAPAAPAQPAVIEGIDPKILAAFDERMNARISGVQSGYQSQMNDRDRRIAELEQQLKTAAMTDDEREQAAEEDARQYVESLELEVALGQLAERFPTSAPHVRKFYELSSAEEIAQYLDSILNPAAFTEPAAQVPSVDANNPPANTPAAADGTFIDKDGQVYSRELRQKILQDLSAGGKSFADLLRGR